MKKYLSVFCVLALVVGCSKENIAPVQSSNEVLLTSYAGQPQTKTTIAGNKIDGFTANWATDDAIGVYTTAGTANAKHTITVLSDGTAKFTGKVAASENEQTLYAYYPYTSSATSNLAAVPLNLPSVQTMTGASYDASAAIMVGKPQAATVKGEASEIGNWKFAHLGSYISISVAGITAETVSTDELVSTVSIKSESKTLSGDFTLNLENGQVAFSKTSDEVNVTVPEGTTLGNLAAWAVTAPFALADEYLTITIVTNRNTISKTVKLTKEFKAGNVYTLGIKIDDNCAPAYIAIENPNLTFNIYAEERNYKVKSNIDWSCDSNNDAFTAKKVDANTLKVRVSKNIYFSARTCNVTVGGPEASTSLSLTQKSLWKTNRGNCVLNKDGSVTITATENSDSPRIVVDNNTLANSVDFGKFTFKIREANLSKGFLHINTWRSNDINYQVQIGGNNKLICSSAWNWGSPHLKEAGTDKDSDKADKDFSIEEINKITRLSFMVSPWSNGSWNNATRFQLWVNDNNDENVAGTTLDFWGTGNPWAPNAENWNNGVDFYIGITNAAGSITLESCDFIPISRSK